MKSFVKFKYDRKDLHESPFVGGKTGQAAQTAANNPGLRNTLNQQKALDPKKSLPMSPKKPLAPNVSGGESVGPQMRQRAKASGQKAGPAPTGIAAVMNRTKKKLQRQSNTETGRKVGRGLQGVGKELLDYKADRERTDTGAGGMGTALRQTGGIGRAAVQGALKAPSERINPKQKKTLGGKLGLKAKERFQRAIGVKPTARTEFGGKMTGDTSKQAEKERLGRIKKGVTQSADTTGLSKVEKERKEKELASKVDQNIKKGSERSDVDSNKNPINKKTADGKAPTASVTRGDDRETDRTKKSKGKTYKQLNIDFNKKNTDGNDNRKEIPKQPTKTNVGMSDREKELAAQGFTVDDEKDSNTDTKITKTTAKNNNDSNTPGNKIVKTNNLISKGKSQRDAKRKQIKNDTVKDVTKKTEVVSQGGGNQDKKLGSGKKPEGETIDVKATEVKDDQISGSKNQKALPQGSKQKLLPPAKTKTKEAKVTKFKRRNVKSPEFKTDGKFDQKKYDAAKGRTKTKGGGGRPRKIVEANRIAAEKEIKKQYGSVANAQMRSYAQMQKDKQEQEEKKKRKTSVMVTRQESYSHWREEFIWETDKKYPDKVKEIKPMSGKNTITINPEDETSKYKRGY